jgi:hypothetical protein
MTSKMNHQYNSDEVAEGIAKFAFRAALSFALISAFAQFWFIAIPVLLVAVCIMVFKEEVREHGLFYIIVQCIGGISFLWGLWMYFILGDKQFASPHWPFIYFILVVSAGWSQWRER